MPDFITDEEVRKQAEATQIRKPNPALKNVRLETLEEGKSVQVMHVGPYADEEPNIRLMHEFAAGLGLTQSGKHHEIYMGDPRRSAPDKLRTIIRHPVSPVKGI